MGGVLGWKFPMAWMSTFSGYLPYVSIYGMLYGELINILCGSEGSYRTVLGIQYVLLTTYPRDRAQLLLQKTI
jgi:hypothetical protein